MTDPEINNEASEKLRADFEKMKATEVEELTEAFKAVKTQMATELEANVEIKGKLESDLTSTKHSLLEVKHQLNMAEKVSLWREYFHNSFLHKKNWIKLILTFNTTFYRRN